MPTVYSPNFAIPSSANVFATIWKLTRTMKAAGWTYKASANGVSKDTSGVATNDLWGRSADPTTDVYSNTSTVVSSASNGVSLPQSTINVSSTTGFPSSGTISVSSTNGWQNITYTGTTATTFTGCSGGTGTIYANNSQVVSGSNTIGLDQIYAWIVLSGPQTVQMKLNSAPTGTPVRGETINQSGSGAEGELLGFIWDSVGGSGWAAILPRTGTFNMTGTVTGSTSGATFTPLSGGTLTTFNREVIFFKDSGVTGGGINYICADGYSESTQLFSSIATNATVSTTVAAGSNGNTLVPSTLNVVSTSGFPSSGLLTVFGTLGYAIISYTGTTATTFTGCSVVFNGSTVVSTGNSVVSGCNFLVPPGCGGVNNSFPSKGLNLRGTAGSISSTSFFGQTASFQNNAQIAATNCTPSSGVSADGSFYCILTNSNTLNSAYGIAFTRLEDTEPGDCDPYIWMVPAGVTISGWANTANTSSSSNGITITNILNSNGGWFLGYQSRGNTTTSLDVVNAYEGTVLRDSITNTTYAMAVGGLTGPMRVVNSPATTRAMLLEPISILTTGAGGIVGATRQYKGRCRWLFIGTIGNTYDTFANKTLLGISVAASSTPCIIVGPYDGTTTPVV